LILFHEKLDSGDSLVICKNESNKRQQKFKFNSNKNFKKCSDCWRKCTFIYCNSNGELALEFNVNNGDGALSTEIWYSFDDINDSGIVH